MQQLRFLRILHRCMPFFGSRNTSASRWQFDLPKWGSLQTSLRYSLLGRHHQQLQHPCCLLFFWGEKLWFTGNWSTGRHLCERQGDSCKAAHWTPILFHRVSKELLWPELQRHAEGVWMGTQRGVVDGMWKGRGWVLGQVKAKRFIPFHFHEIIKIYWNDWTMQN